MAKEEAMKQLTTKPIAFWMGHYSFYAPEMTHFIKLWQDEVWLNEAYNENNYEHIKGLYHRLKWWLFHKPNLASRNNKYCSESTGYNVQT
jgi:hypothetical protein